MDQALRQRLQGKTPEEMAGILGRPSQRGLFDFDILSDEKQVIGANPMDLTGIEMVAIKTFITEASVFTIMAHPDAAQTAANALSFRTEMGPWAESYAHDYLEDGVMDFAFYALSDEEVRTVERNTGHQGGCYVKGNPSPVCQPSPKEDAI